MEARLRLRDGYVNVTLISAYLNDRALYNDYIKLARNKSYVDSMTHRDGVKQLVYRSKNCKGSTWVHPKIALHIARWKDVTELIDRLVGFVDDTVPVKTYLPTTDRVGIQTVAAAGLITEARTSDGFCNASALAKSFTRRKATTS